MANDSLHKTRREFMIELGRLGLIAPTLPGLIRQALAQTTGPIGGGEVFVSISMRNGLCPEAATPGTLGVTQIAAPDAYTVRQSPLRISGAPNGFDMLDIPALSNSNILPGLVVACGIDGKPTGHDDYSTLGAVYRGRRESVDQVLAQNIYTCSPPIPVLNMANPDAMNKGQSVSNGLSLPFLVDPASIHSKISSQIALGSGGQALNSLNLTLGETTQQIETSLAVADRNRLQEYSGFLGSLNEKISQMCVVSESIIGGRPNSIAGFGSNPDTVDLVTLAALQTDLIRVAILAGIRIINIYVQRSPGRTAQTVHQLSHEAVYQGAKRDHFRWIMEHYFAALANKLRTVEVTRGMILVANELGIRDSLHGRWGHVYPMFVWGSQQPWQTNPQGRVVRYEDSRKPKFAQSDFHYGALGVQFFTSVMDFFGVSPNSYQQNGQAGFGDPTTVASEDSNYTAHLPFLGQPLPGLRNT